MRLGVGERDGCVVIGLTLVGVDDSGRACLLDPADAAALGQALEEAIVLAKLKRES